MVQHIYINAIVVTVDKNNTILNDGAVVVLDNLIGDVGHTTDMLSKYPKAEVHDAKGMAILPGFINTHTHLSMTMLRNTADDILDVNWLPIVWGIEKYLTPETVYAGALLGVSESIAAGVTTFNDHYFHMDQVAKVVESSGIRAHLAHAIVEHQGLGLTGGSKGETELEKGVRFVEDWHNKADGRIVGKMGPHSLYSCSTNIILKAHEAAKKKGVGIHMHVAESKFEMKLVSVKDKKGETSVQHLNNCGVFDVNFVLAHGLTIDDTDIKILADKHVGISHCPQAYAHIGGAPFPPIDKWSKAGIAVGMGTDGAASNNNLDMIDEMRFATLTRKLLKHDGSVLSAQDMIRAATIEGAKVLGEEKNLGSIEKGKKADIILIKLRQPHMYPLHNILNSIVYSATGADVDTTIVDGKVLMENRKIKTMNVEDSLDIAQKEFEILMKKAGWNPSPGVTKSSFTGALSRRVLSKFLGVTQVLTGAKEPEENDIV